MLRNAPRCAVHAFRGASVWLLCTAPIARIQLFGAFLDTTGALSERRRNRRRPGECRAGLSKYAAARPLFALPVIRSVLDFALNFFEDGITRRSAKLSQAAKPPLESRGALFECRATPYNRIDTGFNLRAPNSSPRAGISAGSARRSNQVRAP